MAEQSGFFRSTGKSLLPADAKAEEMLRSVGSNQVVKAVIKKQRRPKAHRFFFVTIANYYHHWPTSHEFQPDNEEHLRAWATVKAGYRDILGERLHHYEGDIVRMSEFIEKAIALSRKKYSFVTIHNGSIVVLSPKSIAYSELDQTQFQVVADKVFGVLESESGISVSQMMEEAKRNSVMERQGEQT